MKQLIFTFILFAMLSLANATEYDCNQAAPEMSGFHNMVLFGHPDAELYAYHLPLFKGDVNGQSGHVNMHVYQGLWNVTLDPQTSGAYAQKFQQKSSKSTPLPFFSVSPRGERFKVPDMICNNDFSTSVIAAFGHVEGNPNFPKPEPLINQLSVMLKKTTVFARRFDRKSLDKLTYILFGSEKQYYLAHYLTDDENSFDQILAVNLDSQNIEAALLNKKQVLVQFDKPSKALKFQEVNENAASPNNKWKLPDFSEAKFLFEAKINGKQVIGSVSPTYEVYFNKNGDLAIE